MYLGYLTRLVAAHDVIAGQRTRGTTLLGGQRNAVKGQSIQKVEQTVGAVPLLEQELASFCHTQIGTAPRSYLITVLRTAQRTTALHLALTCFLVDIVLLHFRHPTYLQPSARQHTALFASSTIT